jgi:hypothetical protein
MAALPAAADDAIVSVGVEGGFRLANSRQFDTAGNNGIIYTVPFLNAGAYIDITYARLIVRYSSNVWRGGKWIALGPVSTDDSSSLPAWTWSSLDFTLLASYPVSVPPFRICPEAGVCLRLCLSFDADGNGTSDLGSGPGRYDAMDDFFLVTGLRLELPLEHFILGIHVRGCLSLTPSWTTAWPDGTYTEFDFEAGLSIALEL